jgi:hypothetical protein
MSTLLPKAMQNNVRWSGKYRGRNAIDGTPIITYHQDSLGNLYAPATAHAERIGKLDYQAAQECADKHLCSACHEPFCEDDSRVFLLSGADWYVWKESPNDFWDEEPPLHIACAAYVIRACPHIREERFFAIFAKKVEYIDQVGCFGPMFHPVASSIEKTLSYDEFLLFSKPKL